MSEFIQYEKEQNIIVLKLNRPPDNFMKLPVMERLNDVIHDIVMHDGSEGMIVTSALQGIFVSGHEIVDIAEADGERKLKKQLRFVAELLLSIQRLHIPTVTLINGHCVGFGMELALATDFRIAADEDINIGFPEVKLGTFPPFGGMYRLVKLIGEARAKELLLKGKLINPATAVEYGLIDAVAGKDSLLEEGVKLLKGFSRHAPLAMTAIKRSVADATLKDFMTVIQEDMEDYATIVHSADYHEGKKALEEGRIPAYKRK